MEYIILFIALLLQSFHRITEGMKNGAIYSLQFKRNYKIDIHLFENLAWYSQYKSLFLLLSLIFGLSVKGIILSMGITMLSSAIGGYHRQKYINQGAGLPEEPKAEWFFNIWYKRFWYNNKRKFISIFSFILLVLLLFLLQLKKI